MGVGGELSYHFPVKPKSLCPLGDPFPPPVVTEGSKVAGSKREDVHQGQETRSHGRRPAVTAKRGRSWQNRTLVHGYNRLVVATVTVMGKSGGREVGVARMPTGGVLEVMEITF